MIVEELFKKIPFAEIISKPRTNVSGISIDSNEIAPGDLFIPLLGKKENGYKFIDQAIQKGAAAIAGEEVKSRRNHVSCIYLPHPRRYLAYLSSCVFGHPSRKLQVIGVTGTNGKTITSFLIEAFLKTKHHNKVGYVGTTSYRWGTSYQPAMLTTPESTQLQRMFRKMVDSGVQTVVVECSSHGLDQGRLDYTHFDVGVFTNLSHDHLDYHGDFLTYRNAKWKLFSALLQDSEKKNKYAIFNIDDSTGRSWAREYLPRSETLTFSVEKNSKANVYVESYNISSERTRAKINVQGKIVDFESPMLGKLNLQNMVAAMTTAHLMSVDLMDVADVLSKGVFVPGRMEKMVDTGNFTVFLDFAHSEDALSKVLDEMNSIKHGRVITVFGCSGDSDKTKRPRMGKVAAEKSDMVIVTSDNPRNEDPEKIIDDVFSGIGQEGMSKKEIFRIIKREDAIIYALNMAQKDDIVLIAGKGNEMYQEIKGQHIPYEDRKVVKAWFRK